jgi:hypothetical protein
VRRSDPDQTSFEGKMRVYLAAHAAKQHERQFGWKNFRVLVVTTERRRIDAMAAALREIRLSRSTGETLYMFSTLNDPRLRDPLSDAWCYMGGRAASLI